MLEIENALLCSELEEAGEQGEREQGDAGRVTLSVRPFRMGDDKEAALKPLEEAAEVYAAWQIVSQCEQAGPGICDCKRYTDECDVKAYLAAEIADTITACVNLAARYGIDLQAALDEVEAANKERGRYGGTES